jgi:predicted enzyme related to lactoylglutathione lyase
VTVELLVNIDVDDVARAEAFYRAAFGLEVGRRFGDDGVELVGGSSKIYLLRKAAGSAATADGAGVRDYRRHWTPVHVDFVVDDVAAAVERAVAAGAVVERPIASYDWGTIAGLADPFGHGLCILRLSARGYDAVASDVTRR